MRAHRIELALSSIAALCLTLQACGSPPSGSGPQGTGRSGETGGSVGGTSGNGAQTGGQVGEPNAYRATVFATQTILCPGQCTSLTASAENGHEPYAFAWQDAVGEGPGPHEVCPEQTTTYQVVASDTAVDGEFGHASQSIAATVEIQVLGADACTLDGGVPIEQPDERELCSIALPYEDPSGYPLLPVLAAGSSLATDASGNLYFAGQYSAALDLGDGLNAIEPTPSAFIAKYSSSCEVVWIKRYNVGSQSIRFNSIAIGPNDELVAVGWLVGNGMFDGIATSGRPDNIVSSLMVRFDASDGSALEVTSPGDATEGSGLNQVAFDSAGDIVIAGWVGALATFDGEALDNSEPGVLIVKLAVSGDVRFAKVFSAAEPNTQIATGPDGAIAVTTMRNGGELSYDGSAIEVPFAHRFAARLDASGQLQWSHDLDVALDPKSPPGIGMIAFDSAGDVAVSHGNFLSLEPRAEEPELLSKLAPDGVLLGTRVIAPPGSRPDQFLPGHFAIDTLDAVVHLTSVLNDGETPVDAGVGGEEKTPNDVVVQKLAPDASLIWRHRFDTDVLEMAWGIALGPDGAVWIGHGKDAGADPISGALRITKLAP